MNNKNTYITKGNIEVIRTLETFKGKDIIHEVAKKLNNSKGGVFASNYDYPGRYSRWEIAFSDPCLELRCFQRKFIIQSLNSRGDIIINPIINVILQLEGVEVVEKTESYIVGEIKENDTIFSEEERSKQNSIFLLIRKITEIFYSPEDDKLGLYGAFGYDLVFQFESTIKLNKERLDNQEDLVLFLPDKLFVNDRRLNEVYTIDYDFKTEKGSTIGLSREERKEGLYYIKPSKIKNTSSKPGDYAKMVVEAKESFRRGDLFEVVPSHILTKELDLSPYEIFVNMIRINPSPYNFFINLGSESLIGSSPEMFVRSEGRKIETCPISGTIKRGRNAMEDSEQIRELLNSSKDESELTMCTDVDRNDKSRICIPGSVNVIGRRQIELYSHLIHTVDHVEGYLSQGFDAIDAFLTHMWAVTITGAPKKAAIEWIENIEETPRAWYGGAIGFILFNGDMNTGMTLRTVRIKENLAQIRVGATLLIDSNPEDEEKETYTKAAALLQSITSDRKKDESKLELNALAGKKVLIVDHEDSFVHTLANYIKQLGGNVTTLRYSLAKKVLKDGEKFDVVVLSPGPGKPERFGLNETIKMCMDRKIPILGVCLGLQGIVEYFGGELDIISYPRHGKKLNVTINKPELYINMENNIQVGLYHSIYAKKVPNDLEVFALDEEGIVMGVQHKKLPIIAVQFHPESILTSSNNNGLRLLDNMFNILNR